MYRALVSGMRAGCVTTIVMLLVVPMVTAGTREGEKTSAMKSCDEQGTSSKMASESMGGPMKSESAVAAQPAYQRLNQVIGKPVLDIQGERLGRIADIVLDSRDNSISYAALSYGGFSGLGDELFAVPWSEFRKSPGKDAYVLDVRKEYLEGAPSTAKGYQIITPNLTGYTDASVLAEDEQISAPESTDHRSVAGFPKNHWPDKADANWAKEIGMLYREGQQMSGPSHQESPSGQAAMMTAEERLPVKYRRATQLIGLPARDLQGQALGRLEGIVVDTQSDKVVYGVVILPASPWALHRKEAIVPWSTVEVVSELAALRLDADREMLEAVAFTPSHFPDLGNLAYAKNIESRFEATPYWETLGYVPGEGPMAEEMRPGKSAMHLNVSAWRPGSEYNGHFDPGLVTTLRGTIQSIGTFTVARHSVEGLRLSVKTSDGQTWTIHVGPRPFIESQGIMLHFGDKVTVMGAPARIDAWLGKVLMASEIECGDQTLRLRDANGTPQWDVNSLTGSGSPGR
jgi:sporulation protein YlmC with PRC-barrel domain